MIFFYIEYSASACFCFPEFFDRSVFIYKQRGIVDNSIRIFPEKYIFRFCIVLGDGH